MVGRDPVLIVRLASRDGGPFGIRGHTSVSFLDHVGSFAALSDLALLGEVRKDPDIVEEIADANCQGKEEEIEEETNEVSSRWTVSSQGLHCSQLRIKKAGIGLDDSDSAIEGIQSVEGTLGGNDSG